MKERDETLGEMSRGWTHNRFGVDETPEKTMPAQPIRKVDLIAQFAGAEKTPNIILSNN